MPQSDQTLPDQGLLLVISGPSGVGKTTIARHIEKSLGGTFSVSVTTRPMGPGDAQGVDYHYVDSDEFERIRDVGGFLEWAEVFGNHYGTPRQPVIDAMADGRTVVLEIDVQGAIQVKRNAPDCYAIFILPPNEPALLKRLRARRRDDEATIQRRYAQARREIANAHEAGIYDTFITNDNLEDAKKQAEVAARNALSSRGSHSRS